MSISRNWCDVCRGDFTSDDVVIKCTACPRKFHADCISKYRKTKRWKCARCVETGAAKRSKNPLNESLIKLNAAVKRVHKVMLPHPQQFKHSRPNTQFKHCNPSCFKTSGYQASPQHLYIGAKEHFGSICDSFIRSGICNCWGKHRK